MKLPILVVDETGEVFVCQSIEEITNGGRFEAVDILDGNYMFFDADGACLKFAVHGIQPKPRIVVPQGKIEFESIEEHPAHANELRRHLQNYLKILLKIQKIQIDAQVIEESRLPVLIQILEDSLKRTK